MSLETPQRYTLQSIPGEILSLIAFHTALTSPSTSLSIPILPLLLTCKQFNDSLSTANNPRLYAKIFATKFDAAAIKRRGGDKTGASGKTWELKRRCIAIKRMRRAVSSGQEDVLQEEDAWTIYLMLLENDGKNLPHLIEQQQSSPASPTTTFPSFSFPRSSSHKATGPLISYLDLYHQHLVNQATLPGSPGLECKRKLLLWVWWLITSPEMIREENIGQLEEFLFILRPYVFAAGQFDIFFAPWTIRSLPLHSLPSTSSQPESNPFPNPYLANHSLLPTSLPVWQYGRELSLTPPILSHAALLCFFSRVDRLLTRFQVRGFDIEADDEDAEMDRDGDGTSLGRRGSIVFRPRTSSRYLTYASLDNSKTHDQDYKRLTRCLDPNTSPGLGIEDWYGKFTGCWEGNFSFFDFDAYRNMLSGESRALYEGQFGEQSQVWKLREVYIRPKRAFSTAEQSRPRVPNTAINAGFDPTSSAFDGIVPLLYQSFGANSASGRRNSATSLTNAVVRLLENNPTDEHLVAMLGGLEGYEMVQPGEVERIIKRREEVDENGETVQEGNDLEVMLLGTGHSAWGEFLLRGRVRLWDGMATLVKEYTPDGRGKWLYRGYIVSGGVYVGRWRDCVTPEQYVGYEGTFTLSQRVDVTV